MKQQSRDHLKLLFQSFQPENDKISKKDLKKFFKNVGIILSEDQRLSGFNTLDSFITEPEFSDLVSNSTVLMKSLANKMIIEDFPEFCNEIKGVYEESKNVEGGKVADYIPQLAKVKASNFAISVTTVDGQRYSIGDSEKLFCVQSTSKPITYCIALEEYGSEEFHKYVGQEPSGRNFNERVLNSKNRPHNPLINSGAISTASLIGKTKGWGPADRWEHVMDVWTNIAGGRKPNFANDVYLSERDSADRNFCLAYMISEAKGFPPETDISDILNFYFQLCSIEVTCSMMSVIASTLANGGICPLTNKRIFKEETVRNCLSIMYTCGMYDYSGEFAYIMGFPGKSGVSGAIMAVIPGVMGFAVWAPALDAIGNSIKGVHVCKLMTERFKLHIFDTNTNINSKEKNKENTKDEDLTVLCFAAKQGNLDRVRQIAARGFNLSSFNYDKRTALHIAICEGNKDIVKYLVAHGSDVDFPDRFNDTPLDNVKDEEMKNLILSTQKIVVNYPPYLRFVDLKGNGFIKKKFLITELERCGIQSDDVRIKFLNDLSDKISLTEFGHNELIEQAFTGKLVIPEFPSFTEKIKNCYDKVSLNREGEVSNYHSELEIIDPDLFAASIFTVDGQQLHLGDSNFNFTLQSVANTLNYCIALEKFGADLVHTYIGREPSGKVYNDLFLAGKDGEKKKPHNALINSGAIVMSSLLTLERNNVSSFSDILQYYAKCSNGKPPSFSPLTALAERLVADRNYCLGYLLKENDAFPPKCNNLDDLLEFYFMSCSIETNTKYMSHVAATLANGGVNPVTKERIFKEQTVKNCLSLMHLCGMNDYSGVFSFDVGLPGKGGISGATIIVIPGVMGICTYSPRVNKSFGLSYKSVRFCEELVKVFNFHPFEVENSNKIDPTYLGDKKDYLIYNILEAGLKNDIMEASLDTTHLDILSADCDNRTILHLAAAEGHYSMIKYILTKVNRVDQKDRWGRTAYDEAKKNGHDNIADLIKEKENNLMHENTI